MSAKITGLDADNIIKQYLAGKSELFLALKIGHSRQVIRNILINNGINPRGRSDAMFTRMAHTSKKERLRLAKKAHDAVRGVKRPIQTLHRLAIQKQKNMMYLGFGETQLNEWLNKRGVDTVQQMAVDRYNIDIASFPVAVELLFDSKLCLQRKNDFEKIKYLTNHGWRVLYIQLKCRDYFNEGFADYAKTFIEETSGNPALIGQYRVIGRDFKIRAEGRLDPDDLA